MGCEVCAVALFCKNLRCL